MRNALRAVQPSQTAPSMRLKTAFTMVELLAGIAIIALLVAVIVPIVGNYVQTAKNTADRQTLTVLNDALTRYKTQGGSLSALTAGASISKVLELLQTPVTWCGVRHQFLKTGTTYPARSLDAVGSGAQYKFYGYGSYNTTDEADIPDGTITSDAPYGKGVGYLERAGSSAATITIRTSSDYVAYQINGGAVSIAVAGFGVIGNISVPAGANLRFWSCAGGADSSFSGGATYFHGYNSNITSLEVRGLTNLAEIYCSSNNLSSLDVSGLVELTDLECLYNNLNSLYVSGCINLDYLNCRSNNLSSLNVNGLKNLQRLYCGNNVIANLNVGECTSLEQLICGRNNLTSLDVSGLSFLNTLACDDCNIDALNLNGCTALEVINCQINNLSSLDVGGLTNLYFVAYYGNPFAISESLLNAFYTSLEPANLIPEGEAHLWEDENNPESSNGIGNTNFIAADWIFGEEI